MKSSVRAGLVALFSLYYVHKQPLLCTHSLAPRECVCAWLDSEANKAMNTEQ